MLFVFFRAGFVHFDNEKQCKKALEKHQNNKEFIVVQGRKCKKMLTFTKLYPAWGMGLDTRKPVFGIFNQVRLKPICSARENSK